MNTQSARSLAPGLLRPASQAGSKGWRKHLTRLALVVASGLVLSSVVSCGTSLGFIEPANLCNCVPLGPAVGDYRHVAKHVPIPNATPIDIDVNTILAWKQDLAMPPDAPRTGRELQVFRLASAYLQNASVNSEDCDIHMEISQVADPKAPRVVVETPVDSEYCPARQNIQTRLAKNGFKLDTQHGGDLPQPLQVQVVGLAFEDFEHNRGSAQVATVWEIHPAIVQ